MPSHTTMWMMAGGSALASACLTYMMTRPSIGSTVSAATKSAAELLRSGYATAVHAVSRQEARGSSPASGVDFAASPAQNADFEEYRQSTLNRLADDERDFQQFLDNLRHAKDRAEFDQFMADRRAQSSSSSQATD